MSREEIDLPFMNMDSADNRRALLAAILALRGNYEVGLKPIRGTASQKQHGYYRGHVVKLYAEWRHRENGEALDYDVAHSLLADLFLRRERLDKATGSLQQFVLSTAKLNTKQMAEYIEECRNWLAKWCDIITDDPDPLWRENRSERAA